MAPTEEMQRIALKYKPNAVCLVPENRKELTTEGGLDVVSSEDFLLEFIKPLLSIGCRVSLFITGDSAQIDSAKKVGATTVELHTGSFCDFHYAKNFSSKEKELSNLKRMASYAKAEGLEVHAGHGLTLETVEEIARIEEIEELNIGHSIVAEAIFCGMSVAVNSMKEAMIKSRTA
jgi:pyridoxine 5-phosphate synthase